MEHNYLIHYGVKGMKWGKRKASIITTEKKISSGTPIDYKEFLESNNKKENKVLKKLEEAGIITSETKTKSGEELSKELTDKLEKKKDNLILSTEKTIKIGSDYTKKIIEESETVKNISNTLGNIVSKGSYYISNIGAKQRAIKEIDNANKTLNEVMRKYKK